jgi:4-amino-4-deoxy-L-arabinose transferase-like glycosyltransferase
MKKHWLIIVFLISYFFLISYKLISHPTPFFDWDETIYAQVGREMIRGKSLIPLWQGNFWLDKPPLVPLAYGIVAAIFSGAPELSTRVFTLLLSLSVLGLIYILYYRLTKNQFIAALTVAITSFTSVFLQRTQVLNVDVFLYLGWLGYVVFYSNFWISLLFLGIGVLSKSLLGFYPVLIFAGLYTFQLLIKQIKPKQFKELLTRLAVSSLILLMWYLVMLAIFKAPFIKAHFYDSMIKRVTASIESHFGKRTFYIDLLINQLGVLVLLSIGSIIYILKDVLRKKNLLAITLSLFFVPWFLFLNLTKTKIDWYIYPVIAQFAFLGIYLLTVIKKYKLIIVLVFLVFLAMIFKNNLLNNSLLTTYYSSYDDSYRLAIYSKNVCKNIDVFVDRDSRQTHDTLKDMNLLIGTSEWWGNHPSIVYYSDKKVNFVYETGQFNNLLAKPKKNECFVVNKNDLSIISASKSIKLEKQFNDLYLFKTK